MVTLLITSAIVLGFVFILLYYWQKSDSKTTSDLLPAAFEPRGLFSNAEPSAEPVAVVSVDSAERRHQILRRAQAADKTVLQDAHSLEDRALYDEALDLLCSSADSHAKLLSLVSYITRSELPVNGTLARLVFQDWQELPDRSSTTKMLHIVALADDASLYENAVEGTMRFWREGRLPDLSTLEMTALFDGEFWLLSSRVRGSGAGFLLKRTLNRVRRELGAVASVNQ